MDFGGWVTNASNSALSSKDSESNIIVRNFMRRLSDGLFSLVACILE